MKPTDHTLGLTQERLKKLLQYDPETGIFVWIGSKSRRVKNGSPAGCVSKATGYLLIKIGYRHFTASRLAWLYMTGEWPENLVDHEDTDRLNNRWSNLRAATHAGNMQNKPVQKNTRSGLKGAHCASNPGRKKKWVAHIRVGGTLRHLGYFATPEEAHVAYTSAAKEAFGEFARS
jgi:hypothetical protein